MKDFGPRRWRPILILGLLAGLAGVGFGYLASRRVPPVLSVEQLASPIEDRVEIGDAIPDFELTDLDGQATRFSDMLERPVVVNFWATWCPPCLREMPLLQALHEKGEIAVLGIDAGEPTSVVAAYLESHGFDYPVWIDPPGTHPPGEATMDLFRRFGGIGLPLTLFVDRHGVVRAKHNGELDESTLTDNVARLMVD